MARLNDWLKYATDFDLGKGVRIHLCEGGGYSVTRHFPDDIVFWTLYPIGKKADDHAIQSAKWRIGLPTTDRSHEFESIEDLSGPLLEWFDLHSMIDIKQYAVAWQFAGNIHVFEGPFGYTIIRDTDLGYYARQYKPQLGIWGEEQRVGTISRSDHTIKDVTEALNTALKLSEQLLERLATTLGKEE